MKWFCCSGAMEQNLFSIWQDTSNDNVINSFVFFINDLSHRRKLLLRTPHLNFRTREIRNLIVNFKVSWKTHVGLVTESNTWQANANVW